MNQQSESDSDKNVLGLILRALFPMILLGLGIYAYTLLSKEQEQEPPPPAEFKPIRTRVVTLEVKDHPIIIRSNGMVQSHNEAPISAEVSGRVVEISPAFEVGSYFSKGDLLVRLDSRDYETNLAIAEAQEQGAKSAVQLAQLNHERSKKLLKRKVATQAVVDQAAATHAQTKAQLDQATAQVEQAKRDLERVRITAPFDGRVRAKTVGLGQSVAAGTPLGQIFAVDYAEVRLPISSNKLQYVTLPELATDPPVDVELRDGINPANETVWQGQIVRTEGTLNADSLELFAIARVDDPYGRKTNQTPLRIGQPVVAAIKGKVLHDVVLLPRDAVWQLDRINLVDKEELTLHSETIVPIWTDEQHVYVQDAAIDSQKLLATTRILYAPEEAKVEIIPEVPLANETATAEAKTKDGKPVAN